MSPIILPKRIDIIKTAPPRSVGAEIGVWKGWFSIEILNNTDVSMLYLVDKWAPSASYHDPNTQADHDANLAECKHHLRGHPARWRVVRGESVEVAKNPPIPIPKLDWVYIDADHSYDACTADLNAWVKHLKPTGVIMGHDYTNEHNAKKWNFGVVDAVNDFCKKEGWEITHLTEEDYASYRLVRK